MPPARSFDALKAKPMLAPLLMSALVLVLVLGFTLIARDMRAGDLLRFDTALLMAFRTADDLSQPIGPVWLHEAARDITALGSFACLGILVLATLGYLILAGRRDMALLVIVAVLGGVALSTMLKLGFNRPRPDLPHATRIFTASFPSGHAMLTAVTFLTLGALLARISGSWRLRIYFIALALLLSFIVGVSRVYLGVHYPSDVLAGWFIGGAWALLCWTIAFWLQQRGAIPAPGAEPQDAG